MTPEQLAKLKELLGLTEELTAENFMDVIGAKITEMSAAAADLKAKLDELSAKTEEVKTAAVEATVDPDILDERAETAEEKIDGLVDKGKIVPASATALKAELIGPPGKRNAYCLSRTVSKTDESVLNGVVKALLLNDPVALGEQTKSQTMALGRHTPGDDEAKADPDEIKRRAERVSA